MKPTYVFPTVKAAMKFRAMMAAWDCVLIVRRRYRTVSIHHAIYASIRDHGYVLGAADALSGVAR